MKSNYNQISTFEKTIQKYESNMKLQMEKIQEQEQIINQLKENLKNCEIVVEENKKLSYDIKKLEQIVTAKNNIICEYQKLTNETAQKFESFITENANLKKKYEESSKLLTSIKNKCNELEKENESLQKDKKALNENYTSEISNIKNNFDSANRKYIGLLHSNELLRSEHERNENLINSLNEKIINYSKAANEINNLKNEITQMNSLLEKKNLQIAALEQENEELLKRDKENKDNLIKLSSKRIELEGKIKHLSNIYNLNEIFSPIKRTNAKFAFLNKYQKLSLNRSSSKNANQNSKIKINPHLPINSNLSKSYKHFRNTLILTPKSRRNPFVKIIGSKNARKFDENKTYSDYLIKTIKKTIADIDK